MEGNRILRDCSPSYGFMDVSLSPTAKDFLKCRYMLYKESPVSAYQSSTSCSKNRSLGSLTSATIEGYQRERIGYCVISGSGVRIVNECSIAWHTSIRSKGSLWRVGSLHKCKVSCSDKSKRAIMCLFRSFKSSNNIIRERVKKSVAYIKIRIFFPGQTNWAFFIRGCGNWCYFSDGHIPFTYDYGFSLADFCKEA